MATRTGHAAGAGRPVDHDADIAEMGTAFGLDASFDALPPGPADPLPASASALPPTLASTLESRLIRRSRL